MKKLIAIMLALICVIGVFAGCSKTPDETKGPNATGGTNTGAKKTITIGLPVKTTVEDYDTNALTLWIEEQTGYDLEFQIYASSAADYKTQLATQLLDPSVELPDMLWRMNGLGDTVWKQYGEEGYFVDLTPYFEDKTKSANWWEAVEMFDEQFVSNVLDRCTADNGKIYAYPNIERGLIDSTPFMAMINKTWLEKVGKSAPTNTDELLDVLRAFKKEICVDASYYPLLGNSASAIGGDPIWWLICLFCKGYDYDCYFALSEDGKKVTTPFTTDEYREALKYINLLVKEGLITDGIFSIATAEYRGAVNNPAGSRVGVLIGHTTVCFNEQGNANLYDYVPLDLYGYCSRTEYGNSRGQFITEDAEDVDACWDILMLLCTKEGAIRVRYGDEGTNWEWCEGKESYTGQEADISLIYDAWGMVQNVHHSAASPTVNPSAEGENCYMGDMDPWMKARYDLNGEMYKLFCKYEEKNGYELPIIVLTDAEVEENKNIRSNCQNVVKTYRTKFCKGTDGMDPNDDADWKSYLDALETEGLETYVAQYQKIYEERYMSKVLGG